MAILRELELLVSFPLDGKAGELIIALASGSLDIDPVGNHENALNGEFNAIEL